MSSKIPQNYVCQCCDYITTYVKDYKKHLETKKHNILMMETIGNGKEIKKILICEHCNRDFKTNSGLWKHKKQCSNNNNLSTQPKINSIDKDDLIMMVLKQNAELIKDNSELRKEQSDIKELILEIVKNGTMNHSHNTTNSHNKAFNLNFFLNETCKNAMNITDFVDSIKLQLSDLMDVGELGYVEGISKIIVKNLNNLDETIRPIHCTDKKRETFYVKDQDHWEKEDDEKTRLKKVVNTIANKNIRLLPQFREKYPEYKNSSARISDTYDKLVIEAMTSDLDKDEKIIKNISNVTTIKK